MLIEGKACPTCHGTGHDHKGRPVVKMVPMTDKHKPYVSNTEHGQKRFHKTIAQGSGCLTCGGIGVVELKAS